MMLAPSPPEGDDAGPTAAALSPGGLPVPPVATPDHEGREDASSAGSSEEEPETSDSDDSSPARAAAASPPKPKKGKARRAAPHELTGDDMVAAVTKTIQGITKMLVESEKYKGDVEELELWHDDLSDEICIAAGKHKSVVGAVMKGHYYTADGDSISTELYAAWSEALYLILKKKISSKCKGLHSAIKEQKSTLNYDVSKLYTFMRNHGAIVTSGDVEEHLLKISKIKIKVSTRPTTSSRASTTSSACPRCRRSSPASLK